MIQSEPMFLPVPNSKYLMVFGFGVLLVLMLVMVLLGLTQLSAINKRLETIVNDLNVKTSLVVALRQVARERSLVLHRMIITADPIDREEELQTFNRLAAEFIRIRRKLDAMSSSELERSALAKLTEFTMVGATLQNEVVDLVLDGKLAQANEHLLKKSIPAQDGTLSQLDQMLLLQRQATERTVREAEQAYGLAFLFTGTLGSSVILLGILIAVQVIRRTTNIEAALHQEKMRAEVTLLSIGEAVITTDINGRVERLNKAAQEMTGWSEQDAYGLALQDVLHVVDGVTREVLAHPFGNMATSHGQPDGQPSGRRAASEQLAVLVARDGREYIIEQNASPIREPDGRAVGQVAVFRDISRSHELSRELTWAASHDALTSLSNRLEFERRLIALLDSVRTERRSHAMLYLDLDQFKVVNDTCGHTAGDELLRQIAEILGKKIRGNDTLARLGGDEFGVLLRDCGVKRAVEIAEMLRHCIVEFHFVWQDKAFEIAASIGLVEINEHSESVASVMSAADSACYMSKDQGRNRVYLYRQDDAEISLRRGQMNWMQRITQALEKNQFRLFRQEIRSLRTDSAHADIGGHYEILLRMEAEPGKFTPPMMFLPAGERYQMMPTIDRWVVRAALNHLALQPSSKEVIYAINLSGQSLGDEATLEFIMAQFKQSGVAPQAICFEVTETAAIANISKATRFIMALKGIGCSFSLDDFGSGMSSLAYLKNLPVDYLKIDGAFVRDIVEDPIDFSMVDAVNSIAHVMGIKTIAEFVENQAIYDKLKLMGVDYVQGHYIHKPEPWV